MSSETAYTYNASKNPGTEANPASLPGVPLRDLTKTDVEQLPRHLRLDVAASPMYRASKLGSEIETADAAAIAKETRAAEKEAAAQPDAATASAAPPDRKENS